MPRPSSIQTAIKAAAKDERQQTLTFFGRGMSFTARVAAVRPHSELASSATAQASSPSSQAANADADGTSSPLPVDAAQSPAMNNSPCVAASHARVNKKAAHTRNILKCAVQPCPSATCQNKEGHIAKKARKNVLANDLGRFVRADLSLPALGTVWVCASCYRRSHYRFTQQRRATPRTAPEDPNTAVSPVKRVCVSLSINEPHHSTNFIKPVDELSEERTTVLRRVASNAIRQLLHLIHATDSGGVLRLLLRDETFVANLGLGGIIRGNRSVASEEHVLRNIVDMYATTQDKQLKRQLLSLYASSVHGTRAPTSILQARVLFDCSTRQVWQARLHGNHKGAGALATKPKYARSRLTYEQCKCLTSFSVNSSNVYMPAHSPTTDQRFLRRLSFAKLHARLVGIMEQLGIPPVGKATIVKLMSGKHNKGYSRMRCYTGLCAICADVGYQNWQALLSLCGTLADFARLYAIPISASFRYQERITAIRTYLRCDFRDECTLDNRTAALCLRFALSHPSATSPFHSPCQHEHDSESAKCNMVPLLYEDVAAVIAALWRHPACTDEMAAEWRATLEECEGRTAKYIGHLMRDANAQQSQDDCLRRLSTSDAQFTLDYMMKYEGSKFAEIQQDCFGKSKISNCGGMAFRRLSGDQAGMPVLFCVGVRRL